MASAIEDEANIRQSENEALNTQINVLKAAVGSPLVESTVVRMTDKTKVYVYVGNQSGYTSGHWYYWNGSAWTDGGVYNETALETDKTLTVSNAAADAKKTGNEITELKNDLNVVADKMQYVEPINLINPNKLVDGKIISKNGKVITNASYAYFVLDVNEGDEFSFWYAPSILSGNVAYICAYDSSGNAVSASGSDSLVHTYTVPSGIKKIAVSVYKTGMLSNYGQFVRGTTSPTMYNSYFEPYYKASSEFTADNVNSGISKLESISESITDEHTDVVEYFYPTTGDGWLTGFLGDNGTVYTGGNYDSYKYKKFSCKEGDIFTVSADMSRICTYYNDAFVKKGSGSAVRIFTVPSGVNKIGITFKSNIDELIKRISAETSYAIKDASIQPKSTTFFHISGNLDNPSTDVIGEYINQENGKFSSNASYKRTTYIEVEEGQDYLIKSSAGSSIPIRYAFYDSTRTYISGAMPTAATYYVLTAPSNAKYIAFSADYHYFPMMIKKAKVDAPFEGYDNVYVLPKYIVGNVGDAFLNLPDKIYAVSGLECNIYFENLTENWEDYAWDVDCSKGKQLARCYRITPTDADAGTYSLTVTMASKSNLSATQSKTVSLIVKASSAGSGESKKIIILGDSTTNNGYAVTKLNEYFANDVMSITTLGTRGTAPNNHEGRSGWRFSSYFNPPNAKDIAAGVENPWYNPSTQTFDASYYFSQTGIAKPDWLFINLGINDMFSFTSDSTLETRIAECITLCDGMITSIKTASPNTKIGICYTIPPNHSQDAFGKAYACEQNRDRYKHNNAMWVNAMIAEYDGRESEDIYTVPLHTCLDTVYNMGLEANAVNSRNSTTYQSPIANGGVHPSNEGYWQIADNYSAFIKCNA